MESYIPLVKAIIISTMFSWGTSEVVITDQYIFIDETIENTSSGNEEKVYQVYDLKRNVIHDIDGKMQYRNSTPIDTLHKYEVHIKGGRGNDIRVLSTSVEIKDFDNYKCKIETKELEESYFLDGMHVKKYSDNSYFAKIPWLDDLLDSDDKRKFAGFVRQEYSPYHYLIYESIQYENQDPKDKVLRIIEKKEVDTTFIHTLLSLPQRDN